MRGSAYRFASSSVDARPVRLMRRGSFLIAEGVRSCQILDRSYHKSIAPVQSSSDAVCESVFRTDRNELRGERKRCSGAEASVNTDGVQKVLRMAIGPRDAEPFWTNFLRSLTRRGLRGVKLVISDAHVGLRAAVGAGRAAPGRRVGSRPRARRTRHRSGPENAEPYGSVFNTYWLHATGGRARCVAER